MLGLSLALNAVAGMGGGAPIDNGVEIVNHANTTATPTEGDGYTVERTTGGGAWDASAISLEAVDGDCELVIHRLAGTLAAGLTTADPALSDSYTFAGYKFLTDGGVSDIYSNGSFVKTNPFKPYMRILYTAATDTLDFFTSNDGEAWGPAVHTVAGVGFGTIHKFDSSLNSAGAKFTAKFTGAA